MSETRQYPGLAHLPDGRILAVTGHPLGGKSIASAEIYEPASDSWSATGPLNLARNGVQPNGLMVLPNGNVLICGSGIGGRSIHEAEVYDPETGHWLETGSMHAPRTVHQSVQLQDGRVLVSGGIDWGPETVHASAEIYDYETGEWHRIANMSTPRFNHRSVLLNDGRVFVAGGSSAYPVEGNVLSSTEIFDPATGTWDRVAPMQRERYAQGLALLEDGRILVAGGASGLSGPNKPMAHSEIFDPRTGRWTTIDPLSEARWGTSATTLANGSVLVVGGMRNQLLRSKAAEIFDPSSQTWTNAGILKQQRNGHRAIVLKDGRVLVCGGFSGIRYLRSCEIYSFAGRGAASTASNATFM